MIRRECGLANGIEPAGMKWMAFRKTRQPQADSAHRAISFNGLKHVFRTSRLKATRPRKHRRDPSLIRTQQQDQEFAHRANSLITSRSRAGNSASNTPFRPFITIIQQGGSTLKCNRTASRRRRFIRFRTTALPSAFVTVNPTFGPSATLPPSSAASRLRQNAAKYGHEWRDPWS